MVTSASSSLYTIAAAMDYPPISVWSALSAAVSVFILSILTFVLRNYTNFQLWTKQNVPGPSPWLHYLDMLNVMAPNFKDMELQRVRRYGKVYGIHDSEGTSLVVADPDVLKDMLIRNFHAFSDRREIIGAHGVLMKMLVALSGDEWRRIRTIISPTFTSGKIKAMFPLIHDAVHRLIQRIDQREGKEVDMKVLFSSLSMDVIARCAFAVNIQADEGDQFTRHALGFMNFSVWRVICIMLTPKFLRKWIQMRISPPVHGNFLENLSLQILSQRRELMQQRIQSNEYTDFMQLMIEAGTQDNDGGSPEDSGQSRKTLTDEEIAANAMLILIAGYETTASTLAYAVHSLACNPDMQERLHDEVSQIPVLDYESVSKLPYLEAVINETLRMYPAVLLLDRQVSAEEGYTFESDAGKVHMPHGTGLIVPVYTIHHMEEYFPEPEKFNPDRFMPENKDKLVPYSFMPFVIGPRNCVGMRFALLEAKLTLATLVQKYRFIKTSKTDEPIDFRGSFINLKAKRVIVKINERQ